MIKTNLLLQGGWLVEQALESHNEERIESYCQDRAKCDNYNQELIINFTEIVFSGFSRRPLRIMIICLSVSRKIKSCFRRYFSSSCLIL